jgi:hypothetical protein
MRDIGDALAEIDDAKAEAKAQTARARAKPISRWSCVYVKTANRAFGSATGIEPPSVALLDSHVPFRFTAHQEACIEKLVTSCTHVLRSIVEAR